jgi:CDP-paratose 2-epimerase
MKAGTRSRNSNGNTSILPLEEGPISPLRPSSPAAESYVLITGGCGFVGANLAHRLLRNGERVLLFDNFSRAGVEQNFAWLRAAHGERVQLRKADLRDAGAVQSVVANASAVFHFAAQVAVTTSLESPAVDFAVNAGGTLNLLEALRLRRDPPPLVFTSTNKVYGALDDVALRVSGDRYEPVDPAIRRNGINERQPLDFYSPYGCSKGAADSYVLDYARTFGLPATVFRMSCIYGPRQFGTEDQGWVAHFLIRALEGDPIKLYGDGRQVRDVLFVDDLVEALLLARSRIGELQGAAFNIGGGPANTTSLRELMNLIATLDGVAPHVASGEWRTGDQRYYVSDTGKFSRATGWRPRVSIGDGVRELHAWLRETRRQSGFAVPAVA